MPHTQGCGLLTQAVGHLGTGGVDWHICGCSGGAGTSWQVSWGDWGGQEPVQFSEVSLEKGGSCPGQGAGRGGAHHMYQPLQLIGQCKAGRRWGVCVGGAECWDPGPGAISSRSTQGLGHSPSAPDARAPSGPDRHLCHFMFIWHPCSWCGSKLRHF